MALTSAGTSSGLPAKSGSDAPWPEPCPQRLRPRAHRCLAKPSHVPGALPLPYCLSLGPSPFRLPALTRSGQVYWSSSSSVEASEQLVRAPQSFSLRLRASGEVCLVALDVQAFAHQAFAFGVLFRLSCL